MSFWFKTLSTDGQNRSDNKPSLCTHWINKKFNSSSLHITSSHTIHSFKTINLTTVNVTRETLKIIIFIVTADQQQKIESI